MDVVLVDVVRTGLMLGRGCGGRRPVSLGQRSQTGGGQDGKLKEELTILQSEDKCIFLSHSSNSLHL